MSSSVSKKRESGIELLRVISMILIICYHFVCFRFKTFGSLGLFSLSNFVMSFFWSGGKYGVILFGLITGYFMINSKISLKKIVKMELQVLFYSISIMILFIILGGKTVTNRELLLFLFPTSRKMYWFFSGYFVLYLAMPFLNNILLKLKKKWFLLLLGILTIIFIVVPSVMLNTKFFDDSIYLIFYYIVGSYIRLYMNNVKGKKWFLIVGCIFYISIIGSTFYIQYLSRFNYYLLGYMYYFTQIYSTLGFASAFCIFIFFKNLKLKENRFINWLGSVSFGVYLFHEHTYMRKFLWFRVFDVNLIMNSPYFMPITFCMAICIYILGGLFEWGRKFIFKNISIFCLRGKELLLNNS